MVINASGAIPLKFTMSFLVSKKKYYLLTAKRTLSVVLKIYLEIHVIVHAP